VSDINAQREAEAAKAEADAAVARARAASKDKVTGLRTVWHYEVTDHRAALNCIARENAAAITAFVEEHVRTHYRQGPIDGVRVWSEKAAF